MKRWIGFLLATVMLSTTLIGTVSAFPIGGEDDSDIPLDSERVEVTSITVEPIVITEQTGGTVAGEGDAQYYRYRWTVELQGKVTFADGNTVSFTGTSLRHRDEVYTLFYEDPQSSENPWKAGNTYKVTVSIGKAQTELSVTIAADGVAADFNNDGQLNDDDVKYLLRHTLFPVVYPVQGTADVNNDGEVNDDDAKYLLRLTLFPAVYPLYPGK